MNKNNLEKVGYEDIIPYALLKFGKMDCVDIYLLLEQFKKANIAEVVDDWFNLERYDWERGFKTIEVLSDGSYALYAPISDDDKESIKKIITDNTNDVVKSFFSKFNINKFKNDKKKLLKKQKETVLKKARILLISDQEEDYNMLSGFGFKYIDHFKSIIIADKYFKEHEEEINKYNIVLKRSLRMSLVDGFKYFELNQKLLSLSCNNSILYFSYKYFISDIYFKDNIGAREFKIYSSHYSEMINYIVMNSIINEWDGSIDPKCEKYQMIQSFTSKKKLALPKEKKELKIRADYYYREDNYFDDWDLNITTNGHLSDNLRGVSFVNSIREELGDFDIIIKTGKADLLYLDKEAIEQCRYTGRELVLLIDSCCNPIYVDNMADGAFANSVEMKYRFVGNLAKNLALTSGKKNFHFLTKKHGTDELEHSIVSEAINLYNEALKQLSMPTIEDYEGKSAEYYDKEYASFFEEREAIRQIERQPIVEFDKFSETVKKYLEYRHDGSIRGNLEGLRIEEDDNKILVSATLENRILGSISFSKDYVDEDYKPFSIQMPTKKGLGPLERVGFYTSNFDSYSMNLKRPDEQQLNFINAFYKKVQFTLGPLVDSVESSNSESAKQKFIRKDAHKKSLVTSD